MMLYVQGQIKTGAPCRSERLAKYNQVSLVFSHLCIYLVGTCIWGTSHMRMFQGLKLVCPVLYFIAAS